MAVVRDAADSEAEGRYLELLRKQPCWKRAAMVSGLNRTIRMLILAELRASYPAAGESELRRRLAGRLLPRDVVIRMFDWDPGAEEELM